VEKKDVPEARKEQAKEKPKKPEAKIMMEALRRWPFTAGVAAELAGVSRVEFLLALGQYKVFPLESELADLERQRA
jgi:hypothetical protein